MVARIPHSPRACAITPVQYCIILHGMGIGKYCCRNINWIINSLMVRHSASTCLWRPNGCDCLPSMSIYTQYTVLACSGLPHNNVSTNLKTKPTMFYLSINSVILMGGVMMMQGIRCWLEQIYTDRRRPYSGLWWILVCVVCVVRRVVICTASVHWCRCNE